MNSIESNSLTLVLRKIYEIAKAVVSNFLFGRTQPKIVKVMNKTTSKLQRFSTLWELGQPSSGLSQNTQDGLNRY